MGTGRESFSNAEATPDGAVITDEHSSAEKGRHHHAENDHTAHTAHLFQEDAEGRVVERLLLPRPTDDPKDPLCWPTWRKHMALCSVCAFVFLSNYITVSISPVLVAIATDLDISITKASYLITINFLLLGLGNLFWTPLSEKIGKRPVLLMCSGLFFVTSIWASVAKSYGSLLAARSLQGFSASSSEALGPAVVADCYFLHERGLWMGLYTLFFTVGTSFGGMFSGFIGNATTEWRWVLWQNSIVIVVLFLVIILFCPETNFKRPTRNEEGEGLPPSELPALQARARSSWLSSLGIMGWYERDLSLGWLFVRPLLTLRYPAVIWCSVTYGVTLGLLSLQATANGGVFPAIYGFSPLAVGNIYCAYLVASFAGSAAGGPISDWIVQFITKRRGGYFVPEFRLWSILPSAILAPLGLLLYGFGLGNPLHFMVPIVGTAITYAILCSVSTTAVTYVVDNYRSIFGETMTAVFALKNSIAFGFSFAVFPWIARDGFIKMCGYHVLIEALVFATAIPMYIYGERLRRWL